jgi:hypothetical protein
MGKYKQYRRTQIAEMTPITKEMQDNFKNKPAFIVDNILVSVSNEDLNNGSPKVGDMIARNPKNHKDLWLVAKEYFEDNFEVI